jgi:phosphoglycerol transferase
VASFFKKRFVSASVLLLLVSLSIFIFRLEIHSFVANAIIESDFIEDNYVNPDDVELTFPEHKRNLVYIFLESTENTFSDTSVGGKITEDFMPELTELKNNNVSFSGKGGKGGAYSYVGTTWTAAAMFTQTAGISVKVPINFDFYGRDGDYMPGIVTLGDILEDAGYTQTLLVGSDADFAARKTYFTEHGNYNIIDVYSLIEDGKLPEDYWEWWGFEDAKLFEFAKEELTRLAALDKPFNFTTLTADTHFPDGYECELCPDKYENQYSNVLACSSKQVYEFINWCKEQPFYENTTIVLAGDHLTMDPAFLAEIDENYVRTTYNCIINSAVEPTRESPRDFATFDLFPTTLAAMGATIEGDRLGLGVNLFSDVETLTERYGFERLDEELEARSDFYIETFYKND